MYFPVDDIFNDSFFGIPKATDEEFNKILIAIYNELNK